MTTQQLIEEWNPEDIYLKHEHLAEATVHKLFQNPTGYAQSLHMELEDLYQFSKMGLWKGIQTFHTATHNRTLRSFLIANMRWSVHYHIWRATAGDRKYKSKVETEDNLVSVISMSQSPQYDEENTNTFYDFIAADNINNFNSTETYPENITISKFEKEGMLSVLTDAERELVRLRLGNDQLTYKEIAAIYGVTKQCIGMKFKKIQSKCKAYLEREAVAI